jgi:hypothetical protein
MDAPATGPFEDPQKTLLAGKITEKLLRKRVLGGHKKQITTVASWFRSDRQGEVKDVIDRMATEPAIPLEKYGGGHRSNIRLTSFEEAMQFAEACEADTEFIQNPFK